MTRREHSGDGSVEILGNPRVLDGPHPLAMVYGGGGVFGIAYGIGVATGLKEQGIDVANAPALGTSAGSWVASAMALGLNYDDFEGMDSPRIPTRHPRELYNRAHAVFGDATHPLVAASAVSLRTGRRHILDGAGYPLAELCAASSAVPGLFPPFRIDDRLYMDGGAWSVTSIDAAAEADSVIVVAPLAGRVLGPMGLGAGYMLGRELHTWRRRHPGKAITMIRPNHEIAALAGRNPLSLFDVERARAVYPLAREQGLHWGETLQNDAASRAAASGQ